MGTELAGAVCGRWRQTRVLRQRSAALSLRPGGAGEGSGLQVAPKVSRNHVRVAGEKVSSYDMALSPGEPVVVQVGRRKFVRVR